MRPGLDQVLSHLRAGDTLVIWRLDRLGRTTKNGMLGTIETADDGHICVHLDRDGGKSRRVAFDPHRYRSFDHGYAVTIHKSQGATVDRAYVLFSDTMDAPLTYVAMTRHRNALRLYLNGEDRPARAGLEDRGHAWKRPARTRALDRS